jgi:hypothetical protein
MMDTCRSARMRNQDRLRELARVQDGHVEIFCSHDAREWEKAILQSRTVRVDSTAMPSAAGRQSS